MVFNDYYQLVNRILEDKVNRCQLIKLFHDMVWNSIDVEERYRNLALDLDYYESDTKRRKEDISFYGDEELERRISQVLQQQHIYDNISYHG